MKILLPNSTSGLIRNSTLRSNKTRIKLRLPPSELPSIVDWAEENIWYEDDSGRIVPLSLYPWQRDILDSLDLRTRRLTLLMNTRAGKSLIQFIVQAYVVAVLRESMMCVWPSEKLVSRFKDTKLEPFLSACPAVQNLVQRNKVGAIHSDGLHYKGGKVYYVTAGGKGALQQIALRWVIADEVDSYPNIKEGSYTQMLMARGANIPDSVFIDGSTPGISGESAVQVSFEASDMSYWVMPHNCGGDTIFTFDSAVQTEEGDWQLTCDKCGDPIEEPERLWMVESGRWVAEHPEKSEYHRGFYINQFYSMTIPFQETMRSYNPNDKLGFFTQRMAVAFDPVESEFSLSDVYQLCDVKPEGKKLARVIGVDTQTRVAPRFEYKIVDFYGDHSHPLAHVIGFDSIPLKDKEEWNTAARALVQVYREARADAMLVDVGGNAPGKFDQIKNSLRVAAGSDFDGGRIKAIKGIGERDSAKWPSTPFVQGERKWGDSTRHDATLAIYSDVLKLSVTGYIHEGMVSYEGGVIDWPEHTFPQLANYRLERRRQKNGLEKLAWRKLGPTESMDCLIYAYAGLVYLGSEYRPRSAVVGVNTKVLDAFKSRR